MTINNILVIVATTLLLPPLLGGKQPRTASWGLHAGLLIFVAFALNENLVGLGLVPWRWRDEYIGFFAFVCCLAYVTAQRFFDNERHVAEVAKEMEMARQIQTSILPRELPRVAGFDISVRYEPMNLVAGDFYDFLRLDDHRLGVLVADVSGHGVPAALIASMLKVAFQTLAEHAADPAAMLTGLNRSFCGQLDGQFITAAYVCIDVRTGEVLYANAGHPPLIARRASKRETMKLGEHGLILGLMPHAAYTNVRVCLERGDRILLYTDGILEASNASREAFGEDALNRLLAQHAGQPAAQFADSVLDAVRRWSAGKSEDDLTLAVIDIL